MCLAQAMLERRRSQFMSDFMGILSNLMTRPCNNSIRFCAAMREWSLTMIDNLHTIGLDDLNTANTIDILILKTYALKVPLPAFTNLTMCSTRAQDDRGIYCHPQPMSGAQFRDRVDEAKAKCRGLCLDCVRADGESSGSCRIPH